MHDIDHTHTGYAQGPDSFWAESEAEGYEMENESNFWGDRPFSEEQEIDLAAELLGVASDEELEQFLGSLFKTAVKGVRKIAPHALRAGRSLMKMARPMIKKHLPGLVSAATPAISGALSAVPYAGPALSVAAPMVLPAIAQGVADALEMEMEGLGPDEYEFESAKRYVRILGSAAQQVANQARKDINPVKVAGKALVNAAQKHIPGMGAAPRGSGNAKSGRWVRHGNKIIITL